MEILNVLRVVSPLLDSPSVVVRWREQVRRYADERDAEIQQEIAGDEEFFAAMERLAAEPFDHKHPKPGQVVSAVPTGCNWEELKPLPLSEACARLACVYDENVSFREPLIESDLRERAPIAALLPGDGWLGPGLYDILDECLAVVRAEFDPEGDLVAAPRQVAWLRQLCESRAQGDKVLEAQARTQLKQLGVSVKFNRRKSIIRLAKHRRKHAEPPR